MRQEGLLEGKVALVTGGSRGIGRAVATRFAREGARVCVNGFDKGRFAGAAARTAREIVSKGGNAFPYEADVSDQRQVQGMVKEVVRRWKRIDILVNNAGICPFEEFLGISEELWDRVQAVNLKGAFLCSQAVAKVMVERRIRGRLIFTSSVSSIIGGELQSHYCPTKAGINLLMKSLAIALGQYGITCNAVLPGCILTDINREQLVKQKPEWKDSFRKRIPLRRVGKPEDLAGAFLFFASEDSAYCTGSMLVVDGGLIVKSQ